MESDGCASWTFKVQFEQNRVIFVQGQKGFGHSKPQFIELFFKPHTFNSALLNKILTEKFVFRIFECYLSCDIVNDIIVKNAFLKSHFKYQCSPNVILKFKMIIALQNYPFVTTYETVILSVNNV